MNTLPPEILQKILSELPRRDLLSATLTTRSFHHVSLTLIYRRIQEIQLFGWDEHAHHPSIKCLETLATPGSIPRAVRHFAVRGIPWIQEDTMRTLSQSLVNTVGLLSLDLDMGPLPETTLFTKLQCSSPSFLPRLNAISLHDHSTAAALVAGRSVEFLRLRAAIDGAELAELLTGLKLASLPLQCLQIWIAVSDLATAVTVTTKVARDIPSLKALGITFSFPTPYWTENLSNAVEGIVDPLIGLTELIEFGLALIPEPRTTAKAPLTSSITCIEIVHHRLPRLRLIEVQWDARELRDGTLRPLGNSHALMRRVWRYPHASRVG